MIKPNQPGGSKYVVRGGSKIVVIDIGTLNANPLLLTLTGCRVSAYV